LRAAAKPTVGFERCRPVANVINYYLPRGSLSICIQDNSNSMDFDGISGDQARPRNEEISFWRS